MYMSMCKDAQDKIGLSFPFINRQCDVATTSKLDH